ncbi:hypothetical protein RADP37_05557 [Roseomonas mucosa]|uniref:Uncharacterized protein n=1 Tax=Roseomonas mucosa TaxID=207340 RepID=A0A4Y1MYM9_9PROT|nr:hypothetical protein RADP37_05557 [Roseomonas mucosa]
MPRRQVRAAPCHPWCREPVRDHCDDGPLEIATCDVPVGAADHAAAWWCVDFIPMAWEWAESKGSFRNRHLGMGCRPGRG